MSKEEPCHLDDQGGANGGKGIQFPSTGYELWVPDEEEGGWRPVGPKIRGYGGRETVRGSRKLYPFPKEAAKAAELRRARHEEVRIVAVSFRLQGHRTKRDAQAALTSALASVAAGVYVEPSKMSLSEFVAEWLPAIRSTVRPSTWNSYSSNLRIHLLPALGATELRHLQPSQLNACYCELLESGHRNAERGLSPKSVRYCHTILHRCLKDAVRWGDLVRNPADLCDPPRRTSSPEMKTWDKSQLREFLASVADDRLYGLFALAAVTGMRRGEICGLRWSDTDLDAARVHVRQSLILLDGKPHFSTPKTATSRRSLSIDPATVTALRAHKARQQRERLAAGPAWNDSGLTFTAADGTLLDPRHVSDSFTRLSRAAGLPIIRLHDLRHTYASIALAAGAHVKVVSARLGHSTVGITLDTYSHLIEGVGESEADRVANLILG